MKRANSESALHSFMSDLLASYNHIAVNVAVDNARSINSDLFQGQNCVSIDVEYQRRSNRWGNSSPGSFSPSSILAEFSAERISIMLPPPPPPTEELSPWRWQGTSSMESDSIRSPTPPARKADPDHNGENETIIAKRRALPKHVRELPY